MPVSKERVEQYFAPVKENRLIKQMMNGKEKMETLFNQLDDYLYPQKNRSSSQPDKATQDLRNTLNEFNNILKVLEFRSGPKNSDGLTDYEANELWSSLSKTLSADPSPEAALTNYLNTHGNKHLSSPEFQCIAAIFSAMHGLQDAAEHDRTDSLLPRNRLEKLDRSIAETERLQRELENRASGNLINLDGQSLSAFRDQLEEESRKLAEDQQELNDRLTSAKEHKQMNLPKAKFYKELENTLQRNEKRKSQIAIDLKSAQKAKSAADKYDGAFSKVSADYEKKMRTVAQTEADYRASETQTRTKKAEIMNKISENRREEEEFEKTGDFSSVLYDIKHIPAKITDLESALVQFQNFINDPQARETIASSRALLNPLEDMDEGIPDEIWDKVYKENPQTSELMKKYDMMKDSLVHILPADRAGVEATKKLFRQMEDQRFEGAEFNAVFSQLREKAVPDRVKQLGQQLEDRQKDARLPAYNALLAERKNLFLQEKALDNEHSAKSRKYFAAKSEARSIRENHSKLCKELCSQIGIKDSKLREEYAKVENWGKLKEQINNRPSSLKKEESELDLTISQTKERLKGKKEALEAEKASLPPSKEEIELAADIAKLNERISAHQGKKNKFNEIVNGRNDLTTALKDTLESESDTYRALDAEYSDRFASAKIHARLSELQTELAAKKRGKDSDEYTAMKNALSDALKVFSGKAENWQTLTPQMQQDAQKKALDTLSERASHYLSEKEKQPHIWPFASISGFQRRAAANNILGYCMSAQDMVSRASVTQYNAQKKIAEYKTPNGAWNENLKTEKLNATMNRLCQNVSTHINKLNQAKVNNAGRDFAFME